VSWLSWWGRTVQLVRAVSEADAEAIESAARELGESRRWLTPIAWTAGTLVLLVRGIKLLVVNWRLLLIQLIPAAWVWLTMWDVKGHLYRGMSVKHLEVPTLAALGVFSVLATVAAFWSNTVFGFAIDAPAPHRIAPAVRRAREQRRLWVSAGLVVGLAMAFAVVVLPRIAGKWVFSLGMSAVIGVMLISFVAVPARIIGVRNTAGRPGLTDSVGRLAAGMALSSVAMAPGFLMGRTGLILLGLKHFHILGFVLLSVGTALYATGMSSVKAVKLSMKLTIEPQPQAVNGPAGPEPMPLVPHPR
jgi:hypothetical protein